MPPIEVFVGLDAVQASAEVVPGLPTREELKKWLAEHDTLEKETEIFDTGELKKLRNFTRGAPSISLNIVMILNSRKQSPRKEICLLKILI